MKRFGIKALNILLVFIISFVMPCSWPPVYAASTVYESGDVVISISGDYEIKNGVTSVKITGDIDVNIILNNVTIDNSALQKHSFIVTGGANANIVLVGTNTLKAGNVTDGVVQVYQSENRTSYGYAGLQVDKTSSVTISGNGSLTAEGGTSENTGWGGAGIGGGYSVDNFVKNSEGLNYAAFTPGKITINSGTIVAKGAGQGAGIGGGYGGATTASSITINGGNITTTGGDWSSGIGDGDSNNVYTNPDYYKTGGYEIRINGGTIVATGGKLSTGIGTTDQLASSGLATSVVNSQDSTLKISILGGNVTAVGGISTTAGESAAAIGAGRQSVMADNSITIGKNVTLNCVSQSNSSISTNTLENANVPSITLDDESYYLIVRFESAETDRTANIKDSEGNVIKTFTIPAGYTSVTTELPGSGTYYYIEIESGTEMKIDVEEGEGLVTGQTNETTYTKDIVSAPLSSIEIVARDAAESIITNDYTFSPGKKTYDVYTQNGVADIDIYFKWEKSNADDGVTTAITIDGASTTYQNDNGTYYVKIQKTIAVGEPIEINFMKNDLNSELIAAKYNLIVNMSEKYQLQIENPGKIYDGKVVSPVVTCEGTLFNTADLSKVEYQYFNNEEAELNSVPIDAGKYKLKATLETGKYIAESEEIEFEITQRKISIQSIENYVKTEDGTDKLSDSQKQTLGLITYNDVISGDTVEITYNKETSCYDKSTIEATQITLYDVTVKNPNYTIDSTQVVYGEIISDLQKAIFTSDDGEMWTKTYGSKITEDCNIHNLTMKAKTVGQADDEIVYSVDIEWGNMEFVYIKGGWDPEKHEFSEGSWNGMDGQNNKISVTNRSNRPVTLSVETQVEFQYSYDITLGLSENNISQMDSANIAENNQFSKVIPYKQDEHTQHVVNLYTVLQGEMPDTNAKTKIGTLTLNLAVSE